MQVGKVYLVGAGPGDPGLLTLRGRECLQQADLVLYDGLVNPLLLQHTQAHAERTARTSSASGYHLDQSEINARMIAAARAGKIVVRLKGGDPFIFGRGSEEATALAAAGICYEVVPGITAAIAAAEYAGISYTHREQASAVAFVTGHEDPAKEQLTLDYSALARFPGTLVFYMGLHHLATIAQALIVCGKPATTPSAVISHATTPAQRTVSAPLGQIAAAAAAAGLRPPSLIVIGPCVQQRERIAWFEQRPLFGLRIGITRPEAQADPQIRRCLELGAEPVLLPTLRILPPASWDAVDAALDRLGDFQWLVFTSSNGVEHFLDRLWQRGGDLRRLGALRIAAIGSVTADALLARHVRPDLVPAEFRAEALAEALAPRVAGLRVLWVRASRGRDVLPTALEAAGAAVEQVAAYQNVDAEALPADSLRLLEAGKLDWIGLSSPAIARNLNSLLSPAALQYVGKHTRLAAISPVTAEAAQEVGLPIAAVAETYTWEGLFAAILNAQGMSLGTQ